MSRAKGNFINIRMLLHGKHLKLNVTIWSPFSHKFVLLWKWRKDGLSDDDCLLPEKYLCGNGNKSAMYRY